MSVGVIVIIFGLVAIEEVYFVLFSDFDVGSSGELPLVAFVVESTSILCRDVWVDGQWRML